MGNVVEVVGQYVRYEDNSLARVAEANKQPDFIVLKRDGVEVKIACWSKPFTFQFNKVYTLRCKETDWRGDKSYTLVQYSKLKPPGDIEFLKARQYARINSVKSALDYIECQRMTLSVNEVLDIAKEIEEYITE